jgi:uncharacterized protein (DUF433 family)
MDRTTGRFDAETLALTSTKTSTRRRGGRSKDAVQSAQADQARRVEYEAFAVSLREEFAPEGVLESIYVERAIVLSWRLREAIAAERAGILGGLGVDSRDIFDRLTDDLRRQSDRADRSLRRALDALGSIRTAGPAAWGRAIALDTTVVDIEPEPTPDREILPNEWTIVPDEFEWNEEPLAADAPLPRWQDRLVFDANISDESPVVKGTWITVSQIVTLIVDGQTWADILRSHPELTEEDIRICLAYATEADNDDSRGVYLP